MDKERVREIVARLSFDMLQKPCPFCGSSAKFAVGDYGGLFLKVKCENCQANMGPAFLQDASMVAKVCVDLSEQWERRVTQMPKQEAKKQQTDEEMFAEYGYRDDALEEARRKHADRAMEGRLA